MYKRQVEHEAYVEVETASPLEIRRLAIRKLAERMPVGSNVKATVAATKEKVVLVRLVDQLDGIVPISELSWSRIEHIADEVRVGEKVRAKVIKIDLEAGKVVLSVKALLEKPYDLMKVSHPVGAKVTGRVRKISKNHAYVDLENGADGVINRKNLAHVHVKDISDFVSEGDEVAAQLVSFNDDQEQVDLSLKALIPNPYDSFKSKHRVGEGGEVHVLSVTKHNGYIDLGGGATGSIFRREIQHGSVEDARDHLTKGQKVGVRIIKFDDDRQEVKLSMKALLPEPYPAFKAAYLVGQAVTGEVNGYNKSFAYLDLPGGAKGVIHVSQLANRRVGSPEEIVTKGQTLRAVIKRFDDEREQIELSLTMAERLSAPPTRSAAVAPIHAQPKPQPAAREVAAPRTQTPAVQKRVARAEGRSVSDAHTKAAASLGLAPGQVTATTLRKEKFGLLGALKQTAVVEVVEI